MNATARKQIVGLIKKSDLDRELINYSAVCNKIKALESEKDRLKRALVKSYFEAKPTYTSKDGAVIASYMPQNRTQFKNAEFKESHPDLYSEFSYMQEVHIFIVKHN